MARTTSRVTPLVEGGILSSIAILFSLISTYLPVFGVFIQLIWPVPILLLVVRHGIKIGVIAIAVSGMLVAMLTHPLKAAQAVIVFGLPGIVLGWCFKQKWSSVKVLLYGLGSVLIAKIAFFAILFVVMGVNPLTASNEAMKTAIPATIDFYRNYGMDQAMLDQMAQSLEHGIKWLALLIPASLLIASFTLVFINFMVGRTILRKMGHSIDEFPALKHWDMPMYVLTGWGGSLLMWMAGYQYFGEQALTFKIGVNAFLLFSILLFLQGLAIFSYFAALYKVPKFFRIAIAMVFMLNTFIALVVIICGAIDLFVNIRQLERKG